MGIKTVAVYSTATRRACTSASPTKPSASARPRVKSYLNIPNIIAAAEITNADAFTRTASSRERPILPRLWENDIKFIGASPEMIEAMGDKASAKATMAAAGVPTIPAARASSTAWRSARLRQGNRLPRHAEGHRRWWRPGHARLSQRRRHRRRLGHHPPRGRGCLRQRRHVHGEVRDGAPPHRDPDRRRQERQVLPPSERDCSINVATRSWSRRPRRRS